MAFEQFEIKVRKAFGNLIAPGQRNVWIDPYHRTGKRFCARTTNGMFVSCNPVTGTISVYKDRFDRHPTVIKA